MSNQRGAGDKKSPNILLISIDSLRRDYSSFIFDRSETTPFLNKFHQKATKFPNAISPSVWTLQVHTSLFTGLYPPEHNVLDSGDSLGDWSTLMEVLSSEGYETASFAINGWLSSGGMLRGADHTQLEKPNKNVKSGLISMKNSDGPGEIVSNGLDLVGDIPHITRKFFFRHRPPDYETVSRAKSFIKDTSSPFCCFVHLNDVHHPYTPTYPFSHEFGNHSFLERRRAARYQHRLTGKRAEVIAGKLRSDSKKIEVIKDFYRGVIKQTDAQIRRLVEVCEREDILEDTIIVVFSDHGDHLGDDGHFGHQLSVSDVLIRVPLLIYDPTGSIEQGEYSDVIQLNDLYPTLLSTVGTEPEETNSVDITKETRETAFTYYSAPESTLDMFEKWQDVTREELPPARQYSAWKPDGRKVVWYPDEDEYENKGYGNEMKEELLKHYESMTALSKKSEEISPETVENLKDMGYL